MPWFGEDVLCPRNLVVNLFAKSTVDKTESGAGVTDCSITGTLDNLTRDSSAGGRNFPESRAIVDEGGIKWCCTTKLILIDEAYNQLWILGN